MAIRCKGDYPSEVASSPLLQVNSRGIFCKAGGFYIDPWKPVDRALITHAHADHGRPGNKKYLCVDESRRILAQRVGNADRIESLPYGESLTLGDTRVSFHPAGHIRGSAQIRIERDGEVWVVSGDYKRDPDPTCLPFEPIRCDVFVTEATFALPIYRWRPTEEIAEAIFRWWQGNRAEGRNSLLLCYALGKAQRVLAELGRFTDDTIWLHGAVVSTTDQYREAGIRMPPTKPVSHLTAGEKLQGALVLAPPSAAGTRWVRRLSEPSVGFCSGWMQVRGQRRRRGYDRGFVLSDHADWQSLLTTIKDTGASRVIATHGFSHELARYLKETGLEAGEFETAFEGEQGGAE